MAPDKSDRAQFEPFDLSKQNLSKYLFFTGKGGVGKTSVACAIAVNLADNGKSVLLVSTDPASNLQDVFETKLNGQGVLIDGVPGLTVTNLDPEEAAREYRESVIAPYKDKLPDSVIANMEEQLSGSCTVEIAAFDQFSNYITDKVTEEKYDHIIFDTAPTGHTLRMLQLPSAWTDFIGESTHGASCLGQLAGLEDKKDIYKNAVVNLADKEKTTLVLISRPETIPLFEADRSSVELSGLGINNQVLIINGVLEEATDALSEKIVRNQQNAMEDMPQSLKELATYTLPLRSYNILGLDNIRGFFKGDKYPNTTTRIESPRAKQLPAIIDDLYSSGKKVIFTMGKGGVGKTTVAATIALALAEKGAKVHLTSTDPANHLEHVFEGADNITVSRIDEEQELLDYQNEVLDEARKTMGEDDLAYIEEDLRSPCTQEIAVFRAFAEIVDKAENEVVVIDTAPTGHTLLLLDSTLSHHREVQRTKGETPPSVQRLLPRIRDAKQTEVIMVTLPEATPVFEATRLRDDLKRAGINNGWWVVNQCLSMTDTSNTMLVARSEAEIPWLDRVREISGENFVALPWLQDPSIQKMAEHEHILTPDEKRAAVRENYAKVANRGAGSCGCNPSSSCCEPATDNVDDLSRAMGYSEDELKNVPEGANMGLGCGNPHAIAGLKPGEDVLDLGSGGGFDCFLAARQVGKDGLVIGVDMTPDMIDKARLNAAKSDFDNVVFRLGEIENLPVADNSVDVILSNCVVNLSSDKPRVFREAFRVLRAAGRLSFSDIVAVKPLPAEIQNDIALLSGCVAGAVMVHEIENMLGEAGFQNVRVTPKQESREMISQWAPDSNIGDYVLSATIEAIKPTSD